MKIAQFPHMPKSIKVKILKEKDGNGFYAELSEYDVFTEADSEEKLDDMINDLIYDLFSVPKEFQRVIKYIKAQDKDFEKVKKLIVMSTPDVLTKYVVS